MRTGGKSGGDPPLPESELSFTSPLAPIFSCAFEIASLPQYPFSILCIFMKISGYRKPKSEDEEIRMGEERKRDTLMRVKRDR